MVYVESWSQPSLIDLARIGNFQALSYWINSFLRPEGVSARIETTHAGCLQILIEFQQELSEDVFLATALREGLVRFICHQLWNLNSPVFHGVRIKARLMGDSDILWNQSVRLITPANRVRRSERISTPERLKFKTLRSLLLVGSSLAAFVIGTWISYHQMVSMRTINLVSSERPPLVSTVSAPPRPDWVKTALENIPVVKPPSPTPVKDPTVTLLFGGDVTLSHSFREVVGQKYDWPFAQLDEYRQADVAMINLENPLVKVDENRQNQPLSPYQVDPESVKVLTNGGVDLVNLANHRIMEEQESGLRETMKTLDQAGIHYVGAGRDLQEARRPHILEVKGKRIAYFGYTEGDLSADSAHSGTNKLENQRISEDIKAIRDQVDWIVVNFHWGAELAGYPGDWQIDLARFTIDQGADLVVGHHSHVLQGAEIYKNRPIIYSLGNFIFGEVTESDYETAVLKVSLNDSQMKVEFLPVEVKEFQPKIVKGEKGDRILKKIEKASTIFDQPMRSPVILDSPSPSQPGLGTPKVKSSPLPRISTPDHSGESDFQKNSQPQTPSPLFDQPLVSPGSIPGESNSLPPTLQKTPLNPSPNTPPESEKNDPFIKGPFIKDPFINPTDHPFPSQGTPSIQGNLGDITDQGLPSFTLISKENSSGSTRTKPIDLPLFLTEIPG